MLSQAVWYGGFALEVLLLVRAFRGKLASRYPIFYTYIFWVLIQSSARLLVHHRAPKLYPEFYWTTEILGVFVGCAIVFEICRVILASYPGTARMARKLLGLVFALAVGKALLTAAINPEWWDVSTRMDLELSLRIVQAVAILALVALFLSYSIPMGRNLRGILLGYGVFVGLSVIQLTFASAGGTNFVRFWSYVHPISYDVVLCVWIMHLWSYRENPVPHANVQLEQQYQKVATSTSQRLREARGYLAKVVWP
ncbi:MAG TPA: hypothetical protein VOA64_04290 [Candidatus Dormibacteraeota bacterium]|nr:hypothetical protein [Candidatus Dormibacteraeota bacterium]